MDPKPHPNDTLYIKTLKRMTPDQRLRKAFELTELGRQLLKDGLRHRHPDLSETELRRLYLEDLAKCRNKSS